MPMPLRVPRCLRGLRRRASQPPEGECHEGQTSALEAVAGNDVSLEGGSRNSFQPAGRVSVPRGGGSSSLDAPHLMSAVEAPMSAPVLRCEGEQQLRALSSDGVPPEGGGAERRSADCGGEVSSFAAPAFSDCSFSDRSVAAPAVSGSLTRSISLRSHSAAVCTQVPYSSNVSAMQSASGVPAEGSLECLPCEPAGSPRAVFGVYLWGLNDSGQLLNGQFAEGPEAASSSPPSAVSRLEKKRIFGCCCAPDRTWLWEAGPGVWGGGNNEGGCFDPDGESLIPRPRLVDGLSGVTCVSAGPSHTVAILESGSAVAFGSNEGGQLAFGASPARKSETPKAMQIDHSEPFLQGQIRLRQAACGDGFSLLLSESGVLMACGQNSHDCLGFGEKASEEPVRLLRPVPALFALPIKQVAAGDDHVLALTISGEVFSWGCNKHGRLGLGEAFKDARKVSTPTLVRLSQRVRYVAAGASHSGLVVSGGLAYLCGSNDYGELGIPVGTEEASLERLPSGCAEVPPVSWSSRFLLLLALQHTRIRMLALGKHFSVALTRSGEVFCWGLNDMNQLGVDPALKLPLTPTTGEDGPPPKAHSSVPLPIWLPPVSAESADETASEGLAITTQPQTPRVRFYLVVAGPYTAAAAGVRGESLSEEAIRAQGLDVFFRSVVVRSQSGVSWSQRKLSATASLPCGVLGSSFQGAASRSGSNSAACSARGVSGGGGLPLQSSPSFDGISPQLPRVLTLSRGVSGAFSVDLNLQQQPSGGLSSVPPFQQGATSGVAGSAGNALSTMRPEGGFRAECLSTALSVEEALRLIEGARSTGDSSHLRSVLSQVFGNITRLNASFAFSGHGNYSDFEGLDLVYAQLPQELLPVVAAGFMACVNAAVKRAEFLKRRDQLKFVLYMLMCKPLYESFCQGEDEGKDSEARSMKIAKRDSEAAQGQSQTDDSVIQTEAVEEMSAEAKPRDGGVPGELLYTALLLLIFRLPPEGKRSFLRLSREFPDAVFGKALVRPATRFLAFALSRAEGKYRRTDRVWHCVAVLELLYAANQHGARRGGELGEGERNKVPIEKFQVEEISALVDPVKEVAIFLDEKPRMEWRLRERQQRLQLKEQSAASSSGSERKRVRLFDVETDVMESCDLQSAWCFFIAHLNLCPLDFKRNVLLVDNLCRQQQMSLDSVLDTRLPYLVLRVRRGHLVQDASTALTKCQRKELFRPLKVVFDGEEGVDEGGLRREFFTLLTRELFSEERGLFVYFEGVRAHWFKRQAVRLTPPVAEAPPSKDCDFKDLSEKPSFPPDESGQSSSKDANAAAGEGKTDLTSIVPEGAAREFWLTGLLASIAIYNDILMPLNLPIAVYKRLQGCPVTLDDLADVFPEELASFRKMLRIEDEDVFNAAFEGMTFSVSVSQPDGSVELVALRPGGDSEPLTFQNRLEFVELYAQYLLVTSVSEQFAWFEKGFHLVSSQLMESLTGQELQLLICGTRELDFNELKETCRYEGYTADSPYIESFWRVLFSFDAYQKQNFLKFVSGSDRSPALGLRELRMTVQRNGCEPTDRLPTAYTCFCALLLPEYATEEKLKRLLTIAIEASEGFGLQ